MVSPLLCLLLTRGFQYPGSVPPPADLKTGFESINEGEAKKILTFLATKCEGRGTGQPGFQKAADFVAAQFRSCGLKPMGDDGTYFQSTTFYRSRVQPGTTSASVAGKTVIGDHDIAVRGTGNIDESGPVALVRAAGSAATAPKPEDLAGKIVILDGEGVSRDFRNSVLLSGATAVLTIGKSIGTATWNVAQTQPTASTRSTSDGTITLQGVRRILDAEISDGEKLLDGPAPTGAASVQQFTDTLRVYARWQWEPVKVSNVVGLVEGSDPTLRDEIVGVGGHLDHLGKRGDVVYPGADDDGSGATAVMCIARALTSNPVKPKRSILLMTFFGEEMGLLGSRFLSEHPPVPLANMVSELQMDMIARDSYGEQNGDPSRMDKVEENIDTMRLVGSKRISTELDRIIQDENKYIGLKFRYDAEDVYTRSDHYNFARHGVPIAFLFDGFTPDYHQPTDTVDKIDWKKLVSAARLYYLTAMTVAGLDHRPVHDVAQ